MMGPDYYGLPRQCRHYCHHYCHQFYLGSIGSLTAIVLSAATASSDLNTATLSPVKLPSSQPNVVVFRDSRRASAATWKREHNKRRYACIIPGITSRGVTWTNRWQATVRRHLDI